MPRRGWPKGEGVRVSFCSIYFEYLTFGLVNVVEAEALHIVEDKGWAEVGIGQTDADIAEGDAADVADVEGPRGQLAEHRELGIFALGLAHLLDAIEAHVSHALGSATGIE